MNYITQHKYLYVTPLMPSYQILYLHTNILQRLTRNNHNDSGASSSGWGIGQGIFRGENIYQYQLGNMC